MAGSTDQGGMNQLLQWGIENSTAPDGVTSDPPATQQQPRDPAKGLDSKMLAQLFGAPSDADLMRDAMAAILATKEQVSLEGKLVAWDNFEQLVEQIDNANNLEPLGLWPPLIGQLDSDEGECRMYAAWCMSTAVQNNIKCQERLLASGGVEKLLRGVLDDPIQAARKKAANALSSEVRNFQPALDELTEKMPDDLLPGGRRVDATDMEEVNVIIEALRQRAARP